LAGLAGLAGRRALAGLAGREALIPRSFVSFGCYNDQN